MVVEVSGDEVGGVSTAVWDVLPVFGVKVFPGNIGGGTLRGSVGEEGWSPAVGEKAVDRLRIGGNFTRGGVWDGKGRRRGFGFKRFESKSTIPF